MNISSQAFVMGMSVIAAGIAVMTGVGAGISNGLAAGKAAEAAGRQPEARSEILSTMVVGQAIAETSAIFGFVVALVLLFANPLVSQVK